MALLLSAATLPLSELGEAPPPGVAWIFVPPEGGTVLLYDGERSASPGGRIARHGERAAILAAPSCGSDRARVRVSGGEGYLRESFLLQDYSIETAPGGRWRLLRQVVRPSRPACGLPAESARFFSLSSGGSIVDASPERGCAAIWDDASARFSGGTRPAAPAPGNAEGLAVFRASDGALTEASAADATAPAVSPDGSELFYRRVSDGTAVRLYGRDGLLREEELPGTRERGRPETLSAVRFEPGGAALTVPSASERARRFVRVTRPLYLVLLADTADAAIAERLRGEASEVLRDPPVVARSGYYPPFPPGRFLVVARRCGKLSEAEWTRAHLSAIGYRAFVRTSRLPGWAAAAP